MNSASASSRKLPRGISAQSHLPHARAWAAALLLACRGRGGASIDSKLLSFENRHGHYGYDET